MIGLMRMFLPLPTLAAGSDRGGEGGAERAVPVWWIWVISLYCIPLAIANVCINNILLPPLITSENTEALCADAVCQDAFVPLREEQDSHTTSVPAVRERSP